MAATLVWNRFSLLAKGVQYYFVAAAVEDRRRLGHLEAAFNHRGVELILLKAASVWHVFCLFNSSSVAFVLDWYARPDTPTPGSPRMHGEARIYEEHSESVWHTNTRRNICN